MRGRTIVVEESFVFFGAYGSVYGLLFGVGCGRESEAAAEGGMVGSGEELLWGSDGS